MCRRRCTSKNTTKSTRDHPLRLLRLVRPFVVVVVVTAVRTASVSCLSLVDVSCAQLCVVCMCVNIVWIVEWKTCAVVCVCAEECLTIVTCVLYDIYNIYLVVRCSSVRIYIYYTIYTLCDVCKQTSITCTHVHAWNQKLRTCAAAAAAAFVIYYTIVGEMREARARCAASLKIIDTQTHTHKYSTYMFNMRAHKVSAHQCVSLVCVHTMPLWNTVNDRMIATMALCVSLWCVFVGVSSSSE